MEWGFFRHGRVGGTCLRMVEWSGVEWGRGSRAEAQDLEMGIAQLKPYRTMAQERLRT